MSTSISIIIGSGNVVQVNQTINHSEAVAMKINQTNANAGDVNNAISEKGPVNQAVGSHSAVQVDTPKESFREMLWTKIKAWWKFYFG